MTDLPHVNEPFPWHLEAWSHLYAQFESGKLPHALLIVGRQRTGKEHLALALSRMLLCAHPKNSYNCGTCHACELSRSGGHGDFHWVSPEENSRVIKIEQVRAAIRFASRTAGHGLRKVIAFSPAESMNLNASNALLKSLEEPADSTFIILVCNRLSGVPATIRSRCQILRVANPPLEASLEWLDKATGKQETSRAMLSLAHGRPLLARELYASGTAEELAARMAALDSLARGQISVPQAGSLWKDSDLNLLLEQLAFFLQKSLSTLEIEKLRTRRTRALFHLLDEVNLLQKKLVSGANPNKQLLVEALLSKFQRELGAGSLGDNIRQNYEVGV